MTYTLAELIISILFFLGSIVIIYKVDNAWVALGVIMVLCVVYGILSVLTAGLT